MSKVIDNILGQVKKLQSDTNRISLLSELDPFNEVNRWIPLGVPGLNNFIRTPGIPSGNVIEVSGKEQSGKTTMSLHIIERAQKRIEDILIIILATERRARSGYPEIIGIEENKIIVERPRTMEDTFSTMEYWMEFVQKKSKEFDKKIPLLFCWDSLGGTTTKAERKGEASDEHMAVAARVIKKNIRRLISDFDDNEVTFLIINQIYDKMAGGFGGGKKTTTYGGRSVKFHSAVRMQLTDIGQIKVGVDKVGQRVVFDLLKCDFSPPNRQIEFPLLYGYGFVPNREDLDFAYENGLLERYKTGYMATFNKEFKWTSEEKYFKLLMDSRKFRRSFLNLLDLKYKKHILQQRESKNLKEKKGG